jgi:hypothetical protein
MIEHAHNEAKIPAGEEWKVAGRLDPEIAFSYLGQNWFDRPVD